MGREERMGMEGDSVSWDGERSVRGEKLSKFRTKKGGVLRRELAIASRPFG